MADEIVGILLAAGFSRRFGADKRLALLADGTPMAVAAARRLRAACARTIVVIRPDDDELAACLVEEGSAVLRCAEAQQGMGHSLAAGVAASPLAAGWLIALADMPYILPGSYLAVVNALRAGAALAQPSHDGKPGHPVGFSTRWLPQLIALAGDRGARDLVNEAASSRVFCAVDDPGIHRDIDAPRDLAA